MPEGLDLFTTRLNLLLKREATPPRRLPVTPPLSTSTDEVKPAGPAVPGKTNGDAEPASLSTQDAVPVGAGEYVVQKIDCLSRIAAEHGHLVETIWNDPANAELREVRENPEILLPEDRVYIPPIRPRSDSGVTEMRHRFIRHGRPSWLRLVLKHNDQPRAGERYVLRVENLRFEGTTDPEGKIEHPIPPEARRGVLEIGMPPNIETREIQVGRLDPIAAVSGVQQRLTNLGFTCGEIDGRFGPRTARALRAYQRKHGLPVTGRPDEATRDKLVEDHGS